nr:hypothetical protein [Candidatus Njordarchaeota archaeon]
MHRDTFDASIRYSRLQTCISHDVRRRRESRDTADYSIAFSMEENATKLHLFVYGIVGTTVTLNMSYTFNNGSTSKPEQATGDIATGAGDIIYLFLIAKDLTTNDPIYSGSSYKINHTETMTVAGASRTACHLNLTGGFTPGNLWWDQQTGIVVKSNFLLWIFGWFNMTLTATSLWSAGLFGLSWTTLAIIGGAAVVLIAVIAIVLRRRH